MNLFIRPAQLKKDGKSVHLLMSEMMEEVGYTSPAFEAFLKTWEEFHVLPNNGILVAEFAETVVGFLSYSSRPNLNSASHVMLIESLAVLGKVKGQKIGTKLLEAVTKIARDNKKITSIILSTNKTRQSYARQFYVKHGFVEKNSAWFTLKLE